MEREIYDIHEPQVQLMMAIHLQEIKRTSQQGITYADLEDYLADFVWKKKAPQCLHEACNDVMRVKGEDIVRFLARVAMVQGAGMSLTDFQDILGGNK